MCISLLVFIIAVLIVTGRFAAGKKLSKEPSFEDFTGTWANEDYTGRNLWKSFKSIIKDDMTREEYWKELASPFITAKLTLINDIWNDSEGNILVNVEAYYAGHSTRHELWRLSNNRKTFELIFTLEEEYPTEIDPNSRLYRVYYRQ